MILAGGTREVAPAEGPRASRGCLYELQKEQAQTLTQAHSYVGANHLTTFPTFKGEGVENCVFKVVGTKSTQDSSQSAESQVRHSLAGSMPANSQRSW